MLASSEIGWRTLVEELLDLVQWISFHLFSDKWFSK